MPLAPRRGLHAHAEGGGPCPIPQKKLTAGSLAQASHQAVTNSAMRERAVRLGKLLSGEDGMARIVCIISTGVPA